MQDAVYDSSGTFTLDPQRARLAREGKLFPTAAHWLLRFVQAAHVAGAPDAHVRWGIRTTTAGWPMSGPLGAAAREMLLEASLGPGPECDVQFSTEGEVVLRVTRGWQPARRHRLDEVRLLHERCRFPSLTLTLDGKPMVRELARPHHAPWFDLHSFQKPQWLGVWRGPEWESLSVRPEPLAMWTGKTDCLVALTASVEGPARCYPMQNGVALEPVDFQLPDIGLLVYFNADGLQTDLGGFQLLAGPALQKARARVREEVKTFLARLWTAIPSLEPRFGSRGDTSLKQFFGLIGGGFGLAVGGPLGALAGAAAGPKIVDLMNSAGRDLDTGILRKAWQERVPRRWS